MTVRISATDWCEGGVGVEDAVEIARAFAEHGAAGIDVSTGQVVSEEQPAFGRSYQTPFADRIRNEIGRKYGVAVIAVGAISSYDDVNSLILAGRADLCALGRTHLYDPQWTLHAAAEQGYAGPGATWPMPFAAGSRKPQAGRTDGPRPRLELIRAGVPGTAHARWRPWADGRGRPVTAFALTGEQQDFAERVRGIASGQLRPLAEAGTPGHVNRELIKAMGDLGLLARLFPQGRGAGAGSPPSGGSPPGGKHCAGPVPAAGGAGHAEHRGGDRAGPAGPRLLSRPAVRAGGGRAALATRGGRRGRGGGVRTDRTRGRIRRRRAGAAGRTRRSGVAADRREDLDLQRARGRLLHRLRADHAQRGRARGERVRGARRPARPGRRAPRHDQPAPDRTAGLRRGAGAGGRAPRRAGPRLPGRDAHTRPVPAQRGRVRGGHGPGRDRRRRGARGYPDRVRRAARRTSRPSRTCWRRWRPAPRRPSSWWTRRCRSHGARALRRGHLLEHLYREVRAPRIYEGASEVQRTIIARELYR